MSNNDRLVYIKWIMNPCHLGNTSMPEEDLAILACPRGSSRWDVAFKNKETKVLVEACFESDKIVESDKTSNGRERVVLDLSSLMSINAVVGVCEYDPVVFLICLRKNNVSARELNKPPWLGLIDP